MKSGGSAPAPDPNIGVAAVKQAETGQQWLNFAKDAYSTSLERQAKLDDLTTQVTQQQLGLATDQANWARSDRTRYENTFQPIENDYIAKATNYGSDAQQAEAAAQATGDVQAAAAAQRDITARQQASLGISPTSGRFAGIQAAQDNATALAAAGAANTARQAVRDKGLALTADAVNLGRGLPSQAGAAAGSAVASGAQALSGNQSTNVQALQAPGIVGQGFAGAMSGYQGMGSTLNQQYSTQMSGWETQQKVAAEESAGIGKVFGTVLGLFPKFPSDENVKKDFSPLPDGNALAAVESMPVEEWTYKQGVADEGRHIGTTAQAFQKATGKGDGKTISAVDAIGVTMGAVKDLSKKVDRIANAVGMDGNRPKAPGLGLATSRKAE
jgi:hypothetical protein